MVVSEPWFDTRKGDFFLFFQFSVKLENKMEFGQAHMKLFTSSFQQNQFSSKTPFEIHFGPIYNDWDHYDVELKINRNRTVYTSMKPITAFKDQLTHVYTLIIYANQTYEIRKDNFAAIDGHLEDDFSYCQPREIPDPYEKKPDDWEEMEEIDDPDDIPPDDIKDILQFIPDPAAKKPPTWDAATQGEWKAPFIPNPLWRGEYKQRRIKNPAFRGDWEPNNVSNPDYNRDYGFGKPEDLCYVGIDVEQDVAGSIWDNILVTDDIAYAEQMMQDTFFAIQDGERNTFFNL
jgi:calreticulin